MYFLGIEYRNGTGVKAKNIFDKDFEENILFLFCKVGNDINDIENISDYVCVNSKHESDSTLSESFFVLL